MLGMINGGEVVSGGAAVGSLPAGSLPMSALDVLVPGPSAAALAELNAQALMASLPANLQHMVAPIAPLQGIHSESQTIEALQQAILATINTGGGGLSPNLFAALHTLGAEQAPQQARAQQPVQPQQPAQPPTKPPPADEMEEPAGAAAGVGAGRKGRRRPSDAEEEDEGSRSLATTREKNRLAQRRFREKQKATIAEQRERIEGMARQLEDYKREVQLLREENNILRAKLEGRTTLHQHLISDAQGLGS